MATMTQTRAFELLELARNDRRRTKGELLEIVDTVGHWAATQRNSPRISWLLKESHETRCRIIKRFHP